MELKYSKPKITIADQRPLAVANYGLPYFMLGPRRFEELVYSIYDSEIKANELKGADDVQLMQGTRERGRDCAMFGKKVAVGVIQCKHSQTMTRISWPVCAREIIKFIIHACIDKRLVGPLERFEYYFVSSGGFTENAILALKSFEKTLLEDSNFAKWINSALAKTTRFKGLSYANIESDFLRLLSVIDIIPIVAQDLDAMLTKPRNVNLLNLFFESKTGAEPTHGPLGVSSTDTEHILSMFDSASIFLKMVPDEFENLPKSTIVREETSEIIDWLFSSLEDQESESDRKFAMLVTGNAGCGKSVVMKQLYEKLMALEIPVLGLKADRLQAESIKALEEKIRINEPIENLFRKLSEVYSNVVILVDQIDALSQAGSVKKTFIDTLNLLIEVLGKIEGVRVIISCREYDLNFDSDLKSYSNGKVVKVKLLDRQVVNSICERLRVEDPLDDFLIELLRTPHHLNVFCKVYRKGMNLASIRSLHDLYSELWVGKVLRPTSESGLAGENCQSALFSLAKKMAEQERTSAELSSLTAYSRELEYLISNGLVFRVESDLQFFHQTFYDYCFAKDFVNSRLDFLKYLQTSGQTLHVRMSARMILTFMRESDHDRYIEILSKILVHRSIPRFIVSFTRKLGWPMSSQYRIHIQKLVLELLGSQDTVTEKEKIFGTQILARRYGLTFLDCMVGTGWISWALEPGRLENAAANAGKPRLSSSIFSWSIIQETRAWLPFVSKHNDDITNWWNACRNLLIRNVSRNPVQVLSYLSTTKLGNAEDLIRRALYFLKNWTTPLAFRLYDDFIHNNPTDNHARIHMLEDAVVTAPEWAVSRFSQIVETTIIGLAPPNSDVDFAYNHIHFVEVLFATHPIIGFEYTLDVVQRISELTTSAYESEDGIKKDLAFIFYRYGESSYSRQYCKLLDLLIRQSRNLAVADPEICREFIAKSATSNRETDLKILFNTVSANPKAYSSEIYRLFESLRTIGVLNKRNEVAADFRDLIKVSYEHLSNVAKVDIVNFIMTLTAEWELALRNGEKLQSYYGYTKLLFLDALPETVVSSDSTLRQMHQQLKRRFPEVITHRARSGGGVVVAPLNASAYAKMTHKQWVKSMKKFNSDHIREFASLRGGLTEHARAFDSEVAARPAHYVSLVENLIDDLSIEIEYIIHGLEGLRKGSYDVREFQRLLRKVTLRSDLTDHWTLRLVWLADYLIENENFDETILAWFLALGLNHPDPEAEGENLEPLQAGANSVRGAVALRLPRLFFMKDQSERILSTAEAFIDDASESVRVALMSQLALLMNLDEARTVDIFVKLSQSGVRVVQNCMWSLQYVSLRHFSDLEHIFKRAMEIDSVQHGLAIICGSAVLRGEPRSDKLFSEILEKSDKAKTAVPMLAIEFCRSPKPALQKKGISHYKKYLTLQDDEIVGAYAHEFGQLKEKDFIVCLPLLRAFASSTLSKRDPHSFFEYLLKCVKIYPRQCIELLERFREYDNRDVTERGYYSDEPIQILIRAYNCLDKSNPSDLHYLDRSLNLFDAMLINSRFAETARRALRQVES